MQTLTLTLSRLRRARANTQSGTRDAIRLIRADCSPSPAKRERVGVRGPRCHPSPVPHSSCPFAPGAPATARPGARSSARRSWGGRGGWRWSVRWGRGGDLAAEAALLVDFQGGGADGHARALDGHAGHLDLVAGGDAHAVAGSLHLGRHRGVVEPDGHRRAARGLALAGVEPPLVGAFAQTARGQPQAGAGHRVAAGPPLVLDVQRVAGGGGGVGPAERQRGQSVLVQHGVAAAVGFDDVGRGDARQARVPASRRTVRVPRCSSWRSHW